MFKNVQLPLYDLYYVSFKETWERMYKFEFNPGQARQSLLRRVRHQVAPSDRRIPIVGRSLIDNSLPMTPIDFVYDVLL